jgi:riboflavin synthase
MFTGIIEQVGVVTDLSRGRETGRLSVRAEMLRDAVLGESIAVNGVCLTVTQVSGDTASFDVSPETLSRTTLGDRRPGDAVNLERALRVGDRMGGHFVQGHVDGVGEVVRLTPLPEGGATVAVRAPLTALAYIVPKGSIAVDGISLTVVHLTDGVFTVAVVQFTLANTVLRESRPGSRVNVEADILAKYAARATPYEGVTEEMLRKAGF